MLKCNDCGNDNQFITGIEEQSRWMVDSEGEFIKNMDVSHTKDLPYQCSKCKSFAIEWEEND